MLIEASEFRNLIIQSIPVLDVRAPIEFQLGSIPGSINAAILNDEERQEIGTLYKAKGPEAALARGYEIVSGELRERRVQIWKEKLLTDSRSLLTCFRGGQRSQIAQTWLQEAGVPRARIRGGYKAFRNFLLTEMERLSNQNLWILSGATGSGKSLVIQALNGAYPTLDLEAYAHHRGSAFGGYGEAQPSQVDFENQLCAALIRIESLADSRPLLVEDESRLIGRCAQPEKFFENLRASPVVYIDEPIAERVEITYQEYILNSAIGHGPSEAGLGVYERFAKSLRAISRKLGGLKFSEIEKDLQAARHSYEKHGRLDINRVWIEKLLLEYYDPMYFRSLEKRSPQILWRGCRAEIQQRLLEGSIKSPSPATFPWGLIRAKKG